MKNGYRLKSNMIMAEWIYEESRDVLFNFVNKNKIDVCSNTACCKIFSDVKFINFLYLQEVIQLLKMRNTWIFHDPVLFVVSIILVSLEENQNVRNYAGKLLDNLNEKKELSKCSIQLG